MARLWRGAAGMAATRDGASKRDRINMISDGTRRVVLLGCPPPRVCYLFWGGLVRWASRLSAAWTVAATSGCSPGIPMGRPGGEVAAQEKGVWGLVGVVGRRPLHKGLIRPTRVPLPAEAGSKTARPLETPSDNRATGWHIAKIGPGKVYNRGIRGGWGRGSWG